MLIGITKSLSDKLGDANYYIFLERYLVYLSPLRMIVFLD